jgi:hypothetical protein
MDPNAGWVGYQANQVSPFDSRASTVLVLGIGSLVLTLLCGFGLLLGPVAWIMGNGVKKDALAAGWPEPGNNKGGRICGIIATVILTLAVLGVVALFVIGALASS